MVKKEKGREEKGELYVTVKVSGEPLKRVMTIRGNREKKSGRITPVAELVREAIDFWFEKGKL